MLNELLSQQDTSIRIAHLFLQLLKVPVTRGTVEHDLVNHPNFPSLLSINDAFTGYGMETLAISVDPAKLTDLPVPFIAPIRGEKTAKSLFSIVRELTHDRIDYFDPEMNQWRHKPITAFAEQWPTCAALLVSAEKATGEEGFRQKSQLENISRLYSLLGILTLPALVVLSAFTALRQHGSAAALPLANLVLTSAGSAICGLLLLYEIGQTSTVLSKICTAGKKINCEAILQSKAAKIAGISWSAIGFSYFMGTLLCLLFTGLENHTTQYFLSYLSVLALPFIAPLLPRVVLLQSGRAADMQVKRQFLPITPSNPFVSHRDTLIVVRVSFPRKSSKDLAVTQKITIMKKFKQLGTTLSRDEQKQINGGAILDFCPVIGEPCGPTLPRCCPGTFCCNDGLNQTCRADGTSC